MEQRGAGRCSGRVPSGAHTLGQGLPAAELPPGVGETASFPGPEGPAGARRAWTLTNHCFERLSARRLDVLGRTAPRSFFRELLPARRATARERVRVRTCHEGHPAGGWPSWTEDVRRRPTLPHSSPCSTIGAERLSFRVRNGTGRFPLAMTAVTLWRCNQAPASCPGVPAVSQEPHSGRVTPPRRAKIDVCVKPSAY